MSASTAKKLAKRVSLILATAALFVPLRLTSDTKLESNNACGSINCCKEPGSICTIDGEVTPDAAYMPNGCRPAKK